MAHAAPRFQHPIPAQSAYVQVRDARDQDAAAACVKAVYGAGLRAKLVKQVGDPDQRRWPQQCIHGHAHGPGHHQWPAGRRATAWAPLLMPRRDCTQLPPVLLHPPARQQLRGGTRPPTPTHPHPPAPAFRNAPGPNSAARAASLTSATLRRPRPATTRPMMPCPRHQPHQPRPRRRRRRRRPQRQLPARAPARTTAAAPAPSRWRRG